MSFEKKPKRERLTCQQPPETEDGLCLVALLLQDLGSLEAEVQVGDVSIDG